MVDYLLYSRRDLGELEQEFEPGVSTRIRKFHPMPVKKFPHSNAGCTSGANPSHALIPSGTSGLSLMDLFREMHLPG